MRRASWLRLKTGRGIACALLCAALLAPASARAEMADGIKLGERLVLHLGIGAEFRYDDNVFYQNSNKAGGFEFRLLASVDMATRQSVGSTSRVDFQLHAGFTYNEYITNRTLLASHRDYGVDLGTVVSFFPRSKFNLTLFENFVRTTQPPYSAEPYNLDRDSNQLGLRVQLAPGGGRLVFGLTYSFGVDFFELDALKNFDTLSHSIGLNIAWKFFPKTALYLAASESIIQYQNPGGNTFERANSFPFHVDLGVMGLITPKLTVNAWIGYGNGFYVKGPSPNTAVGGFALNWKPTLMTTGSIGYQYDFANSLLGSYDSSHKVFIGIAQLIWRFTLGARLGYSNLTYEGIDLSTQAVSSGGDPTKPTTSRVDNVVSFDLRLDYPFKRWLTASAGYDLQDDTSPSKIIVGSTPGAPGQPAVPVLVPVNYLTNEVWLRLSAQY